MMVTAMLALAAGQAENTDSPMLPRKPIPSAYVCLNVTELQITDSKAVSVYVDGEGFRPAAYT